MDLLAYFKPAVDYVSGLVDTDLVNGDEIAIAQAVEGEAAPFQGSLNSTDAREGPDAIEGGATHSQVPAEAANTTVPGEDQATASPEAAGTAPAQPDLVEATLATFDEVSAAASNIEPPQGKILNQPHELLRCHFDPSASYLFNRKPVSLRSMTHEMSISSPSGSERYRAHRLDAHDRTYVLGLFTTYRLTLATPLVNFDGPDLLVTCMNQVDLQTLFNKIEQTGKLGPLCAQVKAKGLPFAPIFWSIRSLSPHQDMQKLGGEIQSYLDRNAKAFGKWRAVYASVESIPCVGRKAFTGDVVIVTEAETFRNAGNKAMLVFQGVQPHRLPSLQGLHKFGTAI